MEKVVAQGSGNVLQAIDRAEACIIKPSNAWTMQHEVRHDVCHLL
jgi:hypothetical protein